MATDEDEIDEIDVAMTLADAQHPIWKFLIILATLLTTLWASDTMM